MKIERVVAVVLVAAFCALALSAAHLGTTRVLIVGDSVSEGWGAALPDYLPRRYAISRIPQNGGGTRNLLANLDRWVIRARADIIVVNAGLHDAITSDGVGRIGPATSLEDYDTNIRALMRRLKSETGARIIFLTTTPIVESRLAKPLLTDADIARRNRCLDAQADIERIDVVDLHYLMAGHADMSLDGLHWSREGSHLMAGAIAFAINPPR
jgi:acyl-CoA thioesterase-1